MPLTLSDQDLSELNTFAMRNFRGDEIAALQQWLNGKIARQMAAQEAAKAKEAPPPPAPSANGRDANPYPAPPA